MSNDWLITCAFTYATRLRSLPSVKPMIRRRRSAGGSVSIGRSNRWLGSVWSSAATSAAGTGGAPLRAGSALMRAAPGRRGRAGIDTAQLRDRAPLASRLGREPQRVAVSAQQVALAKERVAERQHLVRRDARQVARERGAGVVLQHHQVAIAELHPAVRLRHRRAASRPVAADMVGDRPGLDRRTSSPSDGRARRGPRRTPTARSCGSSTSPSTRAVLEHLAPVQRGRAVGPERPAGRVEGEPRPPVPGEVVLARAVHRMPAASSRSSRSAGAGPSVRTSFGATAPTPGSRQPRTRMREEVRARGSSPRSGAAPSRPRPPRSRRCSPRPTAAAARAAGGARRARARAPRSRLWRRCRARPPRRRPAPSRPVATGAARPPGLSR